MSAEELKGFDDIAISKAITTSYNERLIKSLENDVVIVGAGPAGLVAGVALARAGFRVTILERQLSSGGGIWGGGMGMNLVVVQDEALSILDSLKIKYRLWRRGVYIVDSIELACALTLEAIRSGATILNLIHAEDLRVQSGKVTGVVINRTALHDTFPIDPITLAARAVIDATGHKANLFNMLVRRKLVDSTFGSVPGEGPMDAAAGEAFVVEKVAEVFPGLWIAGMSVCAAFGGPRMGPIFGGMLNSGKRAAGLIEATLKVEK